MKKILIILMVVAGIFGSTCAIDMFFNDGELINIMAQSEIVQKGEEDEPTHIHEYSEWELTKPVKCDESGQEERYCSCGQKQTRALSSTGHSYGEWSVSKKPNCEENGTEDRFCQCGSKQSKLIAAIGHSYGEYSVTRFATCEEDGEEASVCQCGLKNTRPIEASGHSYGEYTVIRNVTCTEDGIEEGVCHCGAKNTKITPSSGHTFGEFSVTKKATCTEAGTEERSCHCGEIQSRAVEATGHAEKITSIVKPATCKEKGLRQTKCKACEEVISSETLPLTDHSNVDYTVTAPSTCTTTGTGMRFCRVCDEILEIETLPALNHNHIPSKVSPTCTEYGYTKYSCTRCPDNYSEDYKDPLGHSLNSNSICSRCGKDFTIDMTTRVGAPIATSDHNVGFAWTTNTPSYNAYVKSHWQGKNLTGKTIKYITVTLKFYNEVDDCIYTVKFKKTGPIEPGEIISMTMNDNEDNLGFYIAISNMFDISLTVKSIAISEIEIEYMDGTTERGKYDHKPQRFSEDEYKNT